MDTIEATFTDRPHTIDPEEWKVRVDLAACYRLIAHFGWDDLILTHNSARVPGEPNHFLINPMGLMFNEITASNLLKMDLEGNLVESSEYEANRAGYVIHSAIYMGRPDVECVIHTHTEADIAVGALEEGLLPLSQWAMRFYNRLGYHDYEGVSLDLGERERLQQSIGNHPVLVLRNHGLLATGRNVAEAFSLTLPFRAVSGGTVEDHGCGRYRGEDGGAVARDLRTPGCPVRQCSQHATPRRPTGVASTVAPRR